MDSSEKEKNPFSLVAMMQDTHIFIAGDIVLDVYIEGNVNRISPEAPVPVLLEKDRRCVLGGAANVAANVTEFGGKAWLCGRVGNDSEGQELKALAEKHQIHSGALLFSETLPTIRKTRLLAGYQQLARIDREVIEDITKDEEEGVLACFEEFLKTPGPKGLVLSDYCKGFLTRSLCTALIKRAQEAGVPVIVDPKTTDLSRFKGSTILKPNMKYGRSLLKLKKPNFKRTSLETEVETVCSLLVEDSGSENVALSLSENGVAVYGTSTKHQVVRFSAQTLQVADVSGAGDTMVAFLAMGLAGGLTAVESTHFSNIASGIACSKLGTATVQPGEFLDRFLGTTSSAKDEKIISNSEASKIALEMRLAGKKIVFTNGCFDLLHRGHLQLLQKARSLGDILIVGLNSDASVRRLKGDARPLQNEEDRAFLLAGLSCVDFVVIFEEDTPSNLIQSTKPHVLVKGGDYKKHEIAGWDIVEKNGGEVFIEPLEPGKSTTGIVKEIRKRAL